MTGYRKLIGWALVASIVTIGVSIGVALGAPAEPTPVGDVSQPASVPDTAPLPDDCLIAPGDTIGSTRWSMMPCWYDIGTPAEPDHATGEPLTLPKTGSTTNGLLMLAVTLLALGVTFCVISRDIDNDMASYSPVHLHLGSGDDTDRPGVPPAWAPSSEAQS